MKTVFSQEYWTQDETTATQLVEDLAVQSNAFLEKELNEAPVKETGTAKARPIKTITSAFVTLMVVGLLLMSGPANAFTASINVDNPNPALGETATFTVKISKVSDEVVNTIELKVTDASGIVSNAQKISCSPDYPGENSGFGYGYVSGYGYTPNFGYGYGYGYENSGETQIACTFEYTPTSMGAYSAQAFVNGQAIGGPSQDILVAVGSRISNPVINTVYTPTTNSQVQFTSLPEGSFNVSISEGTSTPDGTNTSGFDSIGLFHEIASDLGNGTFSVNLTFSYPDADNDGTVDGTSLNENNLNVFFWTGTAWQLIPNPAINTTDNTIKVTVDHFTAFAVMAQVPGAPAPPTEPTTGGIGFGGFEPRRVTTTPNTPQPVEPPAPPTQVPPAQTTPTTGTPAPVPTGTGTQGTPALPPGTGLVTAGTGLFGLAGNTPVGLGLLVIAALIGVLGVRSTWLKKKK
ncbi:MAG: hypothetical protein Q7K34_04745 [archaeon]|nr:hypothetical protein [archaeon]